MGALTIQYAVSTAKRGDSSFVIMPKSGVDKANGAEATIYLQKLSWHI